MKRQPMTYREIREYLESKLIGKAPKRGVQWEVMKLINHIGIYEQPLLARLLVEPDYNTWNNLRLLCGCNWKKYFLTGIRIKINDYGFVTAVEMFDSDDTFLDDVIAQINLEYAERRCQA